MMQYFSLQNNFHNVQFCKAKTISKKKWPNNFEHEAGEDFFLVVKNALNYIINL